MDTRLLTTFVYVAELASFTRAAAALGYAQSTVSFQIKQLEAELGAKLFERINHTVALTDSGREVLQYAHRINQLSEEMLRSVRQEKRPAGHIRLAAADSLCPMLLGTPFLEFRRRYPDVSVKVIAAETSEMYWMLDHNEADLVLTLDSHIYKAEYVIAGEEKVRAHFVAAPDHPLARRQEVDVRELLQEPFMLTELGMSYRRLLEEHLAEQSLEIRPVLEIGDVYRICRLVEQGAGLSFLPDYATAEAERAGRLAYLSVKGFDVDVWKQLLYHRDKWVSPPMQAVMEYCRSCEMES